MSYKVFLVEDEIVTREGIRDNVDWASAGFEFCGEAPDGEIALPLIEETKPDVLITDIKMPFMDGLQLSKIIQEHMPWVKIIILSGHDEFEYAQSAVKLGVTEYLLKPISAQDLINTLEKVAATLDREKQEIETLRDMKEYVAENLVLARENFLRRFVMGGISSAEAVEQSQQLGLDIVARYYLVILIHIELCDKSRPFDYYEYQQVERIVSGLAGDNPDVFATKKDLEELVLLVKGNSLDQLQHEGRFLADFIRDDVEAKTTCQLWVEVGSPQDRLGDIHRSFGEALVKLKNQLGGFPPMRSVGGTEQTDLIQLDHAAIENYLKFGSSAEFDAFFAACILPVGEAALRSELVKDYLFVDILLTATQFVSDWGGAGDKVDLDIRKIENSLSDIRTIEGIKAEMKKMIVPVLNLRDNQASHERGRIFQQAKAYIDNHFTDPTLQMSLVADQFNVSPSHFSTVFSQEVGETFRDYLSKKRINKAKELLWMTNLQCSEVAKLTGYKDPHYFSTVFKKKTGLTPQQFRVQSQDS